MAFNSNIRAFTNFDSRAYGGWANAVTNTITGLAQMEIKRKQNQEARFNAINQQQQQMGATDMFLEGNKKYKNEIMGKLDSDLANLYASRKGAKRKEGRLSEEDWFQAQKLIKDTQKQLGQISETDKIFQTELEELNKGGYDTETFWNLANQTGQTHQLPQQNPYSGKHFLYKDEASLINDLNGIANKLDKTKSSYYKGDKLLTTIQKGDSAGKQYNDAADGYYKQNKERVDKWMENESQNPQLFTPQEIQSMMFQAKLNGVDPFQLMYNQAKKRAVQLVETSSKPRTDANRPGAGNKKPKKTTIPLMSGNNYHLKRPEVLSGEYSDMAGKKGSYQNLKIYGIMMDKVPDGGDKRGAYAYSIIPLENSMMEKELNKATNDAEREAITNKYVANMQQRKAQGLPPEYEIKYFPFTGKLRDDLTSYNEFEMLDRFSNDYVPVTEMFLGKKQQSQQSEEAKQKLMEEQKTQNYKARGKIDPTQGQPMETGLPPVVGSEGGVAPPAPNKGTVKGMARGGKQQMSSDDESAFNWAKSNPNDPRAKQIIDKLTKEGKI